MYTITGNKTIILGKKVKDQAFDWNLFHDEKII